MEINPGIRKFVNWLLSEGFNTQDSGDGETHDYECDREYSYVTMVTDPENFFYEIERLKTLLESAAIKVVHQSMEPPDFDECCIQGSYCPVDGYCIIDLLYVHDSMLD